MLQSLLDQLSRFRPYVETTVAACNALRSTLLEDMRRRLDDGDERLKFALLIDIEDAGDMDSEKSDLENCRDELQRLENRLRFCGVKFVPAFAERFAIDVKILSPPGTINRIVELGEVDTAIVWFNGVNRYDSVVNFEDQRERARISQRKSDLKRRLDADQ